MILLSPKKLLLTFIMIIAGFGIFGGLCFESTEKPLGSCCQKRITTNNLQNIFAVKLF
jgi:hypothetical protein